MKKTKLKTMVLTTTALTLFSTNVFAQNIYTTTDLNLRKKPNKQSEVVKLLEPQTKLEILEDKKSNKKWQKVKYKNKEGYVALEFTSKDKTKTLYVNSDDGLNLRKKPTKKSKIIKAVTHGTELTIVKDSIDKNSNWVKGVNKNGKYFYVHKDYLSKEKQSTFLGRYKITHYCPNACCCSANGQTASGITGTPYYTLAMKDMPFGTKLVINGQTYEVQDRGVGYGVIDIMVSNHDEAMRLGTYYADVYMNN